MDLSVRQPPVSPVPPTQARGEPVPVLQQGELAAALQEAAQVLLPKIVQRITEEALAAAWEKLEAWRPAEGKSPAENTLQLQQQYLNMKSQILALDPPDEALQGQMLDRLEVLMEGHVEKLLQGPLGPLTNLLAQSGQDTAAQAVHGSLLCFVLGKLSPKHPAWPQSFLQREGPPAGPRREGAPPARSADYGMVHYGPEGKTDLRPPPPRASAGPAPAPRHDQAEADPFPGVVITRTAKRDTLPLRFPTPFTPTELETSNTFARHLTRFGMAAPVMEEPPGPWLGVKAGVLWLKGQCFGERSGVSPALAQVLQNGVERQISTAIRAAAATPQQAPPPGGEALRRAPPPSMDGVYAAFRAVVAGYQARRDPGQAVLRGIFTAFEAEQEPDRPEERGRPHARLQAEGGDGPLWTPAEGVKRWLKQLKASWDQFQRDTDLRLDLSLDLSHLQEAYSAWASALAPEPPLAWRLRPSLPTLLGWGTLALAIGAAALALLAR